MAASYVDHIGIGVPDLAAAKERYDEFMPLAGFGPWFPADESQCNYGPLGASGTQIFLYRASDLGPYTRHGVGLQHLAFGVPDRGSVDAVHRWAEARDAEVVHEPRRFPEYGDHCYATYFLDPHGVLLEVVSHATSEGGG